MAPHSRIARNVITLLGLLALIGIPGEDVAAQNIYTPSPDYDFALVYYKLVAETPDFKALVKNMQAYKDANEREEPAVMRQLTKRLRGRFRQMNVSQKLLTIRTRLRMDVQRQPQKDRALLKLKLPANRPLYFPVQPGKRDIALIMKDFKRFREIPLKPLEANYIDSRASDSEDIIMYLVLQPLEADAKTPLRLDGIQQWPLLTRIARLGLYNEDDDTIWEYKAPWFTTEEAREVRELFRK